MRRREAVAALIAGALIILALLAVFAITLSNNQARSRSVVEAQAHQRAVLVAGLIDSVFSAISRPGPQSLAEYGRAAVSDRALAAQPGGRRLPRAARRRRPRAGGLAGIHGPGASRNRERRPQRARDDQGRTAVGAGQRRTVLRRRRGRLRHQALDALRHADSGSGPAVRRAQPLHRQGPRQGPGRRRRAPSAA